MARKKTERKQKKVSETFGLKNILNSEKTDCILGLLLFGLAIYAIIAMVSFIRTGQADQSLLEQLRPGDWSNDQRVFKNYGQSTGAIISYLLIKVCFGLPAFIIPLFLAVTGLKLMKIYTISLTKWFFYMAFVMIWTSVAFAKFLAPIMPDSIYNPGGDHGLLCVQHMENVMGPPGLTGILLLSAIIFMVIVSSHTMNVIRKSMNPVKYLTNKIKVTITNPQETENEDESTDSDSISEYVPTSAVSNDTDESETPQPETTIDMGTMVLEANAETLAKPVKEPSESQLKVSVMREDDKSGSKTLAEVSDIHTPINPKEPYTKYKYPTLDLLKKYDNDSKPIIDMEEIKANNEQIVKVLKSFGIDIREIKATVGPTITLYEITPAPGVKISRIRNLEDDIALSLRALGIRIIAPIPGKGTIGIEVPNRKPQIVSMESILNTRKFQETKYELPVAIGKTITNEVYMVDLAKIPHLLVAGATGQGKSVGLNAIITSLLYKKHPNELKFVLIDPKKVEFSIYQPIAEHFMASLPENDDEPIITDVTKVVRTLKSLCTLMDHRYDLLKMAAVRNVKEYNEKFVNHKLDLTKGHDYMPYIVVVIDEFGDLIMTAGKEIETPIARIAQLARAVGIHMVIATQRPTTSIITGNIKANFPGRMAFKVSAMIDSRTILDRAGANQLIGRGDMLILNGKEPDPVRVQCAFVDTPEVEAINEYISHQPGPQETMELPEPASDDNGGGPSSAGSNGDMGALDPLFEDAARSIVLTQQGSTSMVQRRFSIGYNRAGRLMDQLEQAGIVGAAHGAKPRDVLIADETQLTAIFQQMRK